MENKCMNTFKNKVAASILIMTLWLRALALELDLGSKPGSFTC